MAVASDRQAFAGGHAFDHVAAAIAQLPNRHVTHERNVSHVRHGRDVAVPLRGRHGRREADRRRPRHLPRVPDQRPRDTKRQTVTVLSGTSLSTLTRSGTDATNPAVKTIVAFAASDVVSVKDAQEATGGATGTVFSHPGAWQTWIVRDGAGSAATSLDTTTTYTQLPPIIGAGPDSLARIGTERRALASDPNGGIERVTTYSTAYPIEPASIVEDAGSGRLNRTTTYEYVASSLGLLLRTKEPLAGASQRWTEYVYTPNNDVSLMTVSLDGGSTKTVTRTCYTTQSNTCATSETGLSPIRGIENWVSGGAIDDDTNVATDYMYLSLIHI